MTKPVCAIVVGVLMFGGASAARAQGTSTDTVRGGVANAKSFAFTPAQSGQFLATLSWDNNLATLVMVVACGNTNPQTFGVGSGSLDRFARLESGLLVGQQCVISVASLDAAAAFRLNVQFTSATPFRTAGLTLRESGREAGNLPGPIDTRLLDESERVLNFISDARR
jgi:hypothetical protein